MARLDGIATSRATKQSKDRRTPYAPLDCFAIARRKTGVFDALWLAMTAALPSTGRGCATLSAGRFTDRLNRPDRRYSTELRWRAPIVEKAAIPPSSNRSRTVSAGSRRSSQGEIALRILDLNSPRPPIETTGAQRASVFGVPYLR